MSPILEKANYIGEVMHSSITQWTTQVWQWDACPEFGAIVCVEDASHPIYGVIYYIKTGSDDPVRQAFAYQKTELELQQEQPQMFEFLKTDFSAIPLGYQIGTNLIYAMPPRPPKLHAFVRLATSMELAHITNQRCVVHALFSQYNKIEYFEELLLAFLRYLGRFGLVSRTLLMQISEQLSLATANDYRRLKMFMDRVGEIAIKDDAAY